MTADDPQRRVCVDTLRVPLENGEAVLHVAACWNVEGKPAGYRWYEADAAVYSETLFRTRDAALMEALLILLNAKT